jgi:hypothetical protein
VTRVVLDLESAAGYTVSRLHTAREEQRLKRPDHRQRLAEALFQGVSRYAQSLSHFQAAQRASAEEETRYQRDRLRSALVAEIPPPDQAVETRSVFVYRSFG